MKATDWDAVAWTPFMHATIPDDQMNRVDPPSWIVVNSRYQVTVYLRAADPFGNIVHLSIKTHDRAARHDWRDLQRIKNEIVGPEYDAVEVYPAESKLVDTSNQFHLWVFLGFELPFGFQTRLLSEGSWQNSRQRPWPPSERPPDCKTARELAELVAAMPRQV